MSENTLYVDAMIILYRTATTEHELSRMWVKTLPDRRRFTTDEWRLVADEYLTMQARLSVGMGWNGGD